MTHSSCIVRLAVLALGAAAPDAGVPREAAIAASAFKLFERDSGPVNYYSLVDSPEGAYLHSAYRAPLKTAVMGWAVPDDLQTSVARVRWRWRAVVLPKGGDECASGKGDSAAAVYLTWRRGLRWHSLKYVWSAAGTKGAICDKKRSLFVSQDTIILETGAPLNQWRTVEVDLDLEFRKHFEGGSPNADVPAFAGIGLMSDGDQTGSPSEADFGGFSVTYR